MTAAPGAIGSAAAAAPRVARPAEVVRLRINHRLGRDQLGLIRQGRLDDRDEPIGGGNGKVKGNQHLVVPDRTPLANLLFTLMRRAEVPYAIAYVTLEEGVTMMTNIVDCDLDGIRIGQRVRVVFKPTEGGPPVPAFTPA